jgi:serine protease inhibitor
MQLGETDLALLSATYFKGKWVCPFDERSTAPLDFHPEKGQAHPVAMMSQRENTVIFREILSRR